MDGKFETREYTSTPAMRARIAECCGEDKYPAEEISPNADGSGSVVQILTSSKLSPLIKNTRLSAYNARISSVYQLIGYLFARSKGNAELQEHFLALKTGVEASDLLKASMSHNMRNQDYPILVHCTGSALEILFKCDENLRQYVLGLPENAKFDYAFTSDNFLGIGKMNLKFNVNRGWNVYGDMFPHVINALLEDELAKKNEKVAVDEDVAVTDEDEITPPAVTRKNTITTRRK